MWRHSFAMKFFHLKWHANNSFLIKMFNFLQLFTNEYFKIFKTNIDVFAGFFNAICKFKLTTITIRRNCRQDSEIMSAHRKTTFP